MADQFTYHQEGFANKYQDVLQKTLVADVVANRRLEKQLTVGKKISRFKLVVGGHVYDESRYTDRTVDTVSDDTQYIEIDKEKYLSWKLHKWDKLQNTPLQAGEEIGRQKGHSMRQYIDADVLAETLNAYDTFDDGDISGTAGNGLDFSVINIPKVATLLPAKLRQNNVEDGQFAYVLDPIMIAYVQQTLLGKDINLTDATFKNGYTGPLVGWSLHSSNNLTFTAKLNMATEPTANDTVVIGDVTFTFKATANAAGHVKLTATPATTLDNLVAAINGSGTGDGTDYYEVSTANRAKLRDTYRAAAVDGTTYLTLTCTGSGRLTVSETFTDATDGWSLKKLHCYAGKKKQVDLIMQQDVQVDMRPEPKQPVNNFFVDALYGKKTFDDAAQRFLDLQVVIG